MSSGGGTTTTQQQSSPWAPIQPYLTDVASQAQALQQSQQGNTQLPSAVAPMSAQTTNALNAGTAYTTGQGASLINNAQGSLTNLMNPQAPAPGNATLQTFANPDNINPYLNAQYQAASQPVIDSVNAIMGQAGRTGSGANQQLLTTNLGQLAANMYGNGYENAANRSVTAATDLNDQFNTGNNLRLSAASEAPALDSAGLANILAQLGIGQAYDAQNNAEAQQAQQQYLYSQQQPWNILQNYSGAVTGLGSLGGSSNGSTTQPGQSLLPSLLGAGASILAAPMTGGTSLLGMLSDRNAKTDIRRIGTADNGLPLYTFRYRGEAEQRFGLMAQDVEKVKPDAVARGSDGFLRVDYARALAA